MKAVLAVDELRIGMYVCELDRPWRETPFLFQGFEIRTQQDIDALRKYCRRVTVLSRDPAPAVALPRNRRTVLPSARDTAGRRFRWLNVEQEIYKINNHPSARPVYQDITTLQKELEKARNSFIKARMLRPRLGLPRELIGAAVFLASDAAELVTGHTLMCDDGYLTA